MNRLQTEAARSGVSKSRGGLWARLDRYLLICVVAGFVVTVLSFFGAYSWLLELLTHFRLQVACGSALLLAAAALRRHPVVSAAAAITAAANLVFLLPYVWPQAQTARAAPHAIRILVANVGRKNEDYEAVRKLVASEHPDVVGLLETDRGWQHALSDVSMQFPYRVLRPESGAYGILLYSRLPLQEVAGSPYRYGGVQTAISVVLDLLETRTTMVLAHLMAPMRPSLGRLRADQLADLARMFESDPNKGQILIGDLNITPWSPGYSILERHRGLANAALGKGYVGTWPTRPAFLRIPIDHCLVSDAFDVADLRAGPDIGSDHLPLIVDLVPNALTHSLP
jgi:endonuclease/exonuclease/phosphatase (EEP) superfamily protein YafD